MDIWRSPTANPKSLEAEDKCELSVLSANHRSASRDIAFAIVLYGPKGDRRHGDGRAALVMEAIESLDPENVTGEILRDAVVDVLVRAQMMPEHSAK